MKGLNFATGLKSGADKGSVDGFLQDHPDPDLFHWFSFSLDFPSMFILKMKDPLFLWSAPCGNTLSSCA